MFSGSRVAVTDPAFSLAELEKLPLATALDRQDALRVPASFQQRHLDLESAFTARTLSRDEVLAQLDRPRLPATIAARLRDYILAEAQSSRASSLDFYSHLVRDSNRIRGRVDRQLVAAAVDVVCAAKADRLREDIQRVLDPEPGMGSKYFNQFDTHKTWHDMGVLVRGAPVDDVNDHFVQVFNEARVNNGGLPASRGVKIRALRYEDYRGAIHPAARSEQARAWLLTTHPEQGDSNYRVVYVAALAAARRNIYIENSFFSGPLVARMLMHKAREFRGRVNCEGLTAPECAARTRDAVQIYLVLPDSSDNPVVDAVGAADFHDMLHLGIKVHRWNPDDGWSASRMLHSKVWLIDYEPGRGGLAYVGAANATQRSHLADNEAGILSNDPDFARQVYERIFMRDITEDSRVESAENFHIVRNANPVVRASRWLRRLLVELFWFIWRRN